MEFSVGPCDELGLRQRGRLQKGQRQAVATRGEQFLAIRPTHPARPRAMAFPDGVARDTCEAERVSRGNLDFHHGAVVGALREIHLQMVGGRATKVKRKSRRVFGVQRSEPKMLQRPREGIATLYAP